jgi:uncharacterized membrane protein
MALYSAWQDLARRPSESSYRRQVTTDTCPRSAVIKAPSVGPDISALLVDQIPGVFLAWRSLPQASIQESGEVWFHSTSNSSATEVRVMLSWDFSAGDTANTPVMEHARAYIEQNLNCFKRLMEN